MNSLYFFLPFILIVSTGILQESFALESYRGENYLDVANPDGSHVLTVGLSPFIETGQYDNKWRKIYTHYIIDDQPTYIKVHNGEASFVFDKNTCSAQIYSGGIIEGQPVISSDSYVPKSSVNGSGTWSIVTSVNNAPCVTEIIETENSIEISGTKSSAAGIFKVRYVKEIGQPLKTILEATNLTALTDRRFGVTQTQSIPQVITFAGQQRDLANHIGQTFDRTWLVNNKGNLLEFSHDLKFSVIDAWDNIESITVNSVSNGVASVSFNYLRNTPILLPNETLVIDPTYSSNNPTTDGFLDDASDNDTCDAAPASVTKTDGTSDLEVVIYEGAIAADCQRSYFDYNISSILDVAIITDVDFTIDVKAVNTARNSDIVSLDTVRASDAGTTIWNKLSTGTVLVSNNAFTTTAADNVSIDLGTTADSEVQAKLTSDFYTFGIKYTDESYDNARHQTDIAGEEDAGATPKPTLTIVYNFPDCTPDEPTDLLARYINSTALTITWTAPTNCLDTYQTVEVQHSTTGAFSGEETTLYSSTAKTSHTHSGVTANENQFYQIRYKSNASEGSLWGAYAPTVATIEVGLIAISSSNNPNELPITFTPYELDADTTNMTVTYDSSYNLACDFRYAIGHTNTTYTGLTENPVTGTEVYSNFTINGVDNDIIDIYCWDQLDNSTDGTERLGQSNVPLFNQIENFQDGVFGTSGKFGALDLMSLIIVIVSMIAFNRTHPYVGVIVMVAMFSVAGYYGLVQPITVMSGFLILVVVLAIAYGRRDNEL